MPCLIPHLINLIIAALRQKKYPNVYYSIGWRSFYVYCPRKGGPDFTPENMQVFKDWDSNKNRKFDYSLSRQRVLNALKRSVYLTLVSSGKDLYEFRFNNSQEKAARRTALKEKRTSGSYGSDGESMPPSSPELPMSPYDEFPDQSPTALSLGDELPDITDTIPMNEECSDISQCQASGSSGAVKETVLQQSYENLLEADTAVQWGCGVPSNPVVEDAVLLGIEEVVTSSGDVAAYLVSISKVFGIPH